MSIQELSVGDLLYRLQKQYPSGVTTMAPCPLCGAAARGGHYCAECLTKELVRRGAKLLSVQSLCASMSWRQEIDLRVEDEIEKVVSEIGE